jgi:ketol-acid reductoisomerase
MDGMYANCSTTAQRGALDWWKKFRDVTLPIFKELYQSVINGNEAQRVIKANSIPNYRNILKKELKELSESELWKTGSSLLRLRP